MSIVNTVRKKVLSLLAAGASLTMAACYGVTSTPYTASGTVRDRQTNDELPDIEVCLRQDTFQNCIFTDDQGKFEFRLYDTIQDEPYEICAHEKSGGSPYGGIYEESCHTVLPENDTAHIDFFLTRRE